MGKYILFMDSLRQEEIETFYHACQLYREYYRGYPKRYHPLTYFREPEYNFQCPPEMSEVYLGFPSFHVRYKPPPILPFTTGPTSGIPPLPQRNLGARFNKGPCKAYTRPDKRAYNPCEAGECNFMIGVELYKQKIL